MSSLEAHIDRLHTQLLTYVTMILSVQAPTLTLTPSIGFWPVAFEELEPFRGLNSKTAKVSSFQFFSSSLNVHQSMVAGLQHDASIAKLKLLELERAVRCPTIRRESTSSFLSE